MLHRVFDRVRALGRVGAYGVTVLTAAGLLAARSAWGDAGEASMVVGRELGGLRDLVGNSHRVRLNGEEIHVASAVVNASVDRVLDRVERMCREGSRDLDGVVQDPGGKLPEELKATLKGMGPFALGILRQQGEHEGVVGCLARPDGGLAGLSERLTAFALSRDLGDIGKLRYVYARDEGGGRVHVVTAWSDGKLRLDRMFPREGEAEGTDAPGTPRPAGARRVLTAEVDGAPYGVRVYDVAGSPERVLASIDGQMSQSGWASMAEVAKVEPNARHFSREGLELLVVAEGGRESTAVSYVTMHAGR